MAPSPRLPPRSTTIIISAPRAFFSFPFPALALAFPLPYCELVKARTYAHTHTQNTDPLFSLCFLFFCLLLPSALRSTTYSYLLLLLTSSTPPTLPLPGTYIHSSPSSKREERTVVCKFPNVWMVAGVVSLVRWSLVTNVNGTFRSRRCRVFLLKIIAHTAHCTTVATTLPSYLLPTRLVSSSPSHLHHLHYHHYHSPLTRSLEHLLTRPRRRSKPELWLDTTSDSPLVLQRHLADHGFDHSLGPFSRTSTSPHHQLEATSTTTTLHHRLTAPRISLLSSLSCCNNNLPPPKTTPSCRIRVISKLFPIRGKSLASAT